MKCGKILNTQFTDTDGVAEIAKYAAHSGFTHAVISKMAFGSGTGREMTRIPTDSDIRQLFLR